VWNSYTNNEKKDLQAKARGTASGEKDLQAGDWLFSKRVSAQIPEARTGKSC